MLFARVCVVGVVSSALIACGGRAVVDAEPGPSGGTAGKAVSSGAAAAPSADIEIHDPSGLDPYRCLEERSQFAASATLIDQEYGGVCARDSDCQIASVRTGCLRSCVGNASATEEYALALTKAGECASCGPPASGDPCAGSVPVCDRGHCVARAQ